MQAQQTGTPVRRQRRLAGRWSALLLACLGLATEAVASPGRIASINLCTDQLLLAVADPAQVVSVSWLAADPAESAYASAAAGHRLNHGRAEELLALQPDLVLAGRYAASYASQALAALGVPVAKFRPANSLDDIAANLMRVARLVGHPERGLQTARRLRSAGSRPADMPPALALRAGGFTVGAHELADDVLSRAGLTNVAAALGLDRWGTLPVETVLRADPQLLVLIRYPSAEPSLAAAIFSHPAVRRTLRSTPSVVIPNAWINCGTPATLRAVRRLQAARAQIHD